MSSQAAGSGALSLPQQVADIAARIERLPQTRTQFSLRAIVGAALFFDAFDGWSMSVIAPVLVPMWHLGAGDVGLLLSIGAFGQLFGALFFGWLAEKIGRKTSVTISVAIFAVVSFMCAFAPNFQTLLVLRVIQGIGLGGELPIGAAYISEFAAAKRRGFFVLIYQNLFAFGMLLVAFIGRFLIPTLGWQGMFFVGAIPAIIVFFLRFYVPESPRWLTSHGRYEEANKIVTKMEEEAVSAGKELPAPEIKPAVPHQETKIAELLSGFYRQRTIVLWVLHFTVAFSNFAITSWLPTMYVTVFKLPVDQALTLSLISSCFNFVASILPTFLSDRIGRKTMVVYPMLFAAVMAFLLFLSGANNLTVIVVLVSLAIFCFGNLSTINYAYVPENYPTRMRAVGSGANSAVMRIASICGPYATGFLLPLLGLSSVFLVVAVVLFIGFIVVFRWAIETKGVPLEELAP
jgi:putative MFS transporter